MARGWESKSVESQQGEESAGHNDRKKSREDAHRESRRHSLEMSRRRILNELASTKSDMRRKSLEEALKHLDNELANL